MPKRKARERYIVQAPMSNNMKHVLRDMCQFEENMKESMRIAVIYQR